MVTDTPPSSPPLSCFVDVESPPPPPEVARDVNSLARGGTCERIFTLSEETAINLQFPVHVEDENVTVLRPSIPIFFKLGHPDAEKHVISQLTAQLLTTLGPSFATAIQDHRAAKREVELFTDTFAKNHFRIRFLVIPFVLLHFVFFLFRI